MIALSVRADAGRHSASYALGHYDTSFSGEHHLVTKSVSKYVLIKSTSTGWGGFTFFIGLLPAAYTFSAIGMISSMVLILTENIDLKLTRSLLG